MPSGRVKWFNESKGYGFIESDETGGGKDVFVHHTGIQGAGFKTLRENQNVEFELIDGDKGPKAVNVRVLEE